MSTGYSRVTVVNGARRADLAVPSALPVCDLVPQLLRFCAPAEQPAHPAAWTLARPGGPGLRLSDSLADLGVLDGEVLELRSQEGPTGQAYVEDVRDAVEDSVDASGGERRSDTTLGFVLVGSAIGLALTALMPFTRQPDRPGTLAAAVLLAGLCMAGGWWSGTRSQPVAAASLIATGCTWGGIAGWLIGTSLDWAAPNALAASAVTALVVTAAARTATALATPHLAGFAVLAGAAVIAAVGLQLWDQLTFPRLEGVLAVLFVGVLPRVSMSVGGLATADYQIRKAAVITQQELVERIRQSSMLLLGGLLGVATVGLLAGVSLAYADSVADQLLGVAVGVGLLLRSRVFSRVLQMALLRVAGVVVLAAQGLRLGSLPEVRPWFAMLVAAIAAGLVALSAAPLSEITHARVKRVLNWTESVVIITLIALAAAALGVYDMVADLTI